MAKTEIGTLEPTFWVKKTTTSLGRDPMGIQNSSAVIYGNLLPGITNLTQRLRYYGFYCWLLDLYENQYGNESNNQDQYNFLRRAELLISFYMAYTHEDAFAIPGIEFARDFLKGLNPHDRFPLNQGAHKDLGIKDEKGTTRVYWTFKSGAFGQYYFGALSLLDMAMTVDSCYFTKEGMGRKLSEAFNENLSQEAITLFTDIVSSGNFSINQLERLKDFDISRDVSHSSEWKMYFDIFLGVDHPKSKGDETFQRRDTILGLLNQFNINPGIKFNQWMLGEYYYINRVALNDESIPAHIGWYTYYAQERIHYAIEVMFNYLLIHMKSGYPYVDIFITEMTDKVIPSFEWDGTLGTYFNKLINDQSDYKNVVEVITPLLKSGALEKAFATAFDYLILTLIETEGHTQVTREYMEKHHLNDPEGHYRRGSLLEISKYFNDHDTVDLYQFMKKWIGKILNDHQSVAYHKMSTTGKQVHKFLVEGNVLIFQNEIAPRMTSPRLQSAYYIVRDLGLVNYDNVITDAGIQLLNSQHQ